MGTFPEMAEIKSLEPSPMANKPMPVSIMLSDRYPFGIPISTSNEPKPDCEKPGIGIPAFVGKSVRRMCPACLAA